jgi:predicted alpha/beta hydrolase family esterase
MNLKCDKKRTSPCHIIGGNRMDNYIIIHGSYGSPDGNWFPWLAAELKREGKDVVVPAFPTPEGQNYESWEAVLKKYSDMINENTVFIAHSIAPIFVCKFLINNKIKVKGIIAVAGANKFLTGNNNYDNVNKSFFMPDSELANINEYIKFIYCFYSDNDPYIPLKYLENFVKVTKAEKNLIPNGGHLNAETGYTSFPEILGVINIRT